MNKEIRVNDIEFEDIHQSWQLSKVGSIRREQIDDQDIKQMNTIVIPFLDNDQSLNQINCSTDSKASSIA